ncbi:hypothetical protein EVAR_88116_1 [Eumeta japonica]|uniref:Uncharacterized protein n=1 Tax=Eumeta variegata TaxID=151549 RepID=A0A4C2AEU0_EUMVA|nr:hypothetical protein EVAR_88116_1 [Eumeta japonica]
MRSDHRVCRPGPPAPDAPPAAFCSGRGSQTPSYEIPRRDPTATTHIENAMGRVNSSRLSSALLRFIWINGECGIHGFRCRIRQLSYILTAVDRGHSSPHGTTLHASLPMTRNDLLMHARRFQVEQLEGAAHRNSGLTSAQYGPSPSER